MQITDLKFRFHMLFIILLLDLPNSIKFLFSSTSPFRVHIFLDINLSNLTSGLFTYWEEDPRRRIILAPHVFCIQLTCKQLNLALALGSF